jgi:ribosomal peptide maturation radical SAM protein 1
VTLFYETKSNLRKDQVRLLRDAGVTRLQPGIESLSDSVLGLMRKGVTGLQNIQLLKWCKEFGVRPFWNLLWGFPGESPEEYRRMTALIPLLAHLPAPGHCADLRLDRFSPNFVDAGRLGLTNIRPFPSYGYIYALPESAVRNLAYYFDFDYQDGRDPWTYAEPVARAVTRWQRAYHRSDLFSVDVDGRLLIWDFRPAATQALTVATGIDRTLYQECDEVREIKDADTKHRLARFVDLGLMIAERDRYLALAIPVGEYRPAPEMWRRTRARKFHTAADGAIAARGVSRGPV